MLRKTRFSRGDRTEVRNLWAMSRLCVYHRNLAGSGFEFRWGLGITLCMVYRFHPEEPTAFNVGGGWVRTGRGAVLPTHPNCRRVATYAEQSPPGSQARRSPNQAAEGVRDGQLENGSTRSA